MDATLSCFAVDLSYLYSRSKSASSSFSCLLITLLKPPNETSTHKTSILLRTFSNIYVGSAVQYYRDAARATLSMEAPRNIGAKTSTASGGKATVEMGQAVSGPDKTPDKQAQSDVMKQKVTELLMTLSVREQEVSIFLCVDCRLFFGVATKTERSD